MHTPSSRIIPNRADIDNIIKKIFAKKEITGEEIFINSTLEAKTISASLGIDVTGTYSLIRPDNRAVGTEIDFGNGLYGIRVTGTFPNRDSTVSLNIRVAEIQSFTSAGRTIQQGGSYQK
jgi:hypothetical protein